MTSVREPWRSSVEIPLVGGTKLKPEAVKPIAQAQFVEIPLVGGTKLKQPVKLWTPIFLA